MLVCELQSGSIPARWTVWPVSRSRGWLKKIEGKLPEEDYTILREEDEIKIGPSCTLWAGFRGMGQ